MSTWAIIAIVFVTIIGLFLLGVYIVIRKVGNGISEVPKDVVKEVFTIVKDKMKKNE